MGKDDNRGAATKRRQVVFEPCELFRAKMSKTARLQVDDIDEPNKMHPVVVETVPARALRPLAIAVYVGFAIVGIDHIVLAGHVMRG
jgi:hypothetical protein